MLVLNFFILSSSFFARLSICHKQKMKWGSQKITTANGIASTMQISIWFRSFSCHGLFAFTANRHRHFAKLRSTSCPTWSLANRQELWLKILLNSCFSPISLDKKRTKHKRLKKKGIKVRTASSEYVFLIILSHWPTLCLSRTGVDICGKDYVEKSRGYGKGIADGNRETENPSTGTTNKDGGADNPGISIADRNKEVNNVGTDIADGDGVANNWSISIANGDRKADNPGTGTCIPVKRVDNLGIGKANTNADKRA